MDALGALASGVHPQARVPTPGLMSPLRGPGLELWLRLSQPRLGWASSVPAGHGPRRLRPEPPLSLQRWFYLYEGPSASIRWLTAGSGKARAGSSVWVSRVGGRGPSTWATLAAYQAHSWKLGSKWSCQGASIARCLPPRDSASAAAVGVRGLAEGGLRRPLTGTAETGVLSVFAKPK